MLEAIELCERIADRKLEYELSDQARMGDHRWWIGDLSGFKQRYPNWDLEYDVEAVLREIYEANVEPGAPWREVVRCDPRVQRRGLDRGDGEAVVERLERRAIDYEVLVIDDASCDATAEVVGGIAEGNQRVRCLRSHYKNGFGLRGPRRARPLRRRRGGDDDGRPL